ncbi:MAG: DUF5691 domain-containing protein [Bacteroidia bacterium]
MHQHIKEIALLGTDRRSIDPELLPASIAKRVTSQEGEPDRLLCALAYGSFHKEAGIIPLDFSDDWAEETVEVLPYTSTFACDILEDILKQEHTNKNRLLKLWIQAIAENKALVKPAYVLPLIKAGATLDRASRELVVAIIGKRGQDLLQYYPGMKYDTGEQTRNGLWEEADAAERRTLFDEILQQNPEQADELLRADWPQEHVRDKLAFLKIISKNLHEASLPLLIHIYKSDFEGVSLKRKTDRQCKRLLCSMLATLAYKPLLNELNRALSPYISTKSSGGILSKLVGKKAKTFTLLKDGDSFWDGDIMNTLLGLEPQNPHADLFDEDVLYWFAEMVAILPFDFWKNILGRDTEDTVAYFFQDTQFLSKTAGKPTLILKQALIDQAILSKNQQLIQALSQHLPIDDAEPLLPHMSQVDFEAYITSQKAFLYFKLIANRPFTPENTWSNRFAENVLRAIRAKLGQGKHYVSVEEGYQMGTRFPVSSLPFLHAVSKRSQHERWFDYWEQCIQRPIAITAQLKQRIFELKTPQ